MIDLDCLRHTWLLVSAIFVVGISIGAILVPVLVLLREIFAAKAAEIRSTR